MNPLHSPEFQNPVGASFGHRSSPTANGVAYRRTLTGIPLSQEIFDLLERIEGATTQEERDRYAKRPLLTVFMESRYLMSDLAIAWSRTKQVLDLGSGLSPRGMIFCRDNPTAIFAELDLPDKMATKIRVVNELTKDAPLANLHLQMGNVTSEFAFKRACQHFDSQKPVAVVCEGLLRYIDLPNKQIMARNIRDLLKTHGGVWITPDIEFLRDAESTPESRDNYEHSAKALGMDVRPNLFRDETDALDFFRGCGFRVDQYTHDKVMHRLASPTSLDLPYDLVRQELSKRYTFVMRLPRRRLKHVNQSA